MITQLAQRIKLTSFSTGAWRPNKLNRTETASVNQKHGTDRARVMVRVCDHPALDKLAKLHCRAYAEHTRLTLPSVQDGMRVLPAGREFEHSRIMDDLRTEHEANVSEFLADYDGERANAPVRLNGLYDANAWPSKLEVAAKFSFATRYLPCPTDGAWGDWLNETARTAQDEFRERLVDSARHLANVCAGDGKLYQSVLDNLRDVCALAGDFNLMDDPVIAQAARELAPVCTHDVDTLRDSKTIRRNVAEQTKTILATLKLS